MQRVKIRKLFIDFEAEERWLNAKSAQGLQLIYYSFPTYVFTKGKPGEYIYRIELLDNLASHPENQAYIEFLGENGVEFLASQFRWVYFRKKSSEGPFELYSDASSKIAHYQRIMLMTGVFTIINGFWAVNALTKRIPAVAVVGLFNATIMVLTLIVVVRCWRRVEALKKELTLTE